MGHGNFGEVYLGVLQQNETFSPIAVKKTKINTKDVQQDQQQKMRSQREALRNELNIMKCTNGHPNVLKLIGAITTNKDNFCVITEYCEFGSLDVFLQRKWRSGLFCDELIVIGDEESTELNPLLTGICYKVCYEILLFTSNKYLP